MTIHLLVSWQSGRIACNTREPTPSVVPLARKAEVTCPHCLAHDTAPVGVGEGAQGSWQDLRQMNKTEARYAVEVLTPAQHDGTIDAWGYEVLTLRLAPRVSYTPDFVVWQAGRVDLVEVKGAKVTNGRVHGYWQGDAAVKFRLARAVWRGGQVTAVCPRPQRLGGGWQPLFLESQIDRATPMR